MKHYRLDLKVAFKHQIMQQYAEFICGCRFATYRAAKTLFVLIPSHFIAFFPLSFSSGFSDEVMKY